MTKDKYKVGHWKNYEGDRWMTKAKYKLGQKIERTTHLPSGFVGTIGYVKALVHIPKPATNMTSEWMYRIVWEDGTEETLSVDFVDQDETIKLIKEK